MKPYKALMVLVVVSLVLSACAGATPVPPTQAPAPAQPTETPAPVQPAATPVPAQPTGTPVPTPQPTLPSVNISTDSIKLAMQLADKAAAGQTADYKGTSGKILGVVMPQFDNEGFRAQYIGMLSEAIQANWSVTTLDAHLSADKQISMIEDLITRKVNAIVFTPVDSAALSKAVQEANAANIPIVADDRSTTGGNVTALVESDNVAHGSVSADMMLAAFQKAGLKASDAKVLDLLGDQASSAGVEREKGFATEAAKDGLTIVTSLPTYWDNAAANAAVLDAFQANPQINAVFSASGCAMLAGIEAGMKSINKWQKIGDPNHIIVVDIDGCPISLQAIRDGYLDADVAQRIPLMGGLGATYAIDAANGNPPTVKDVLLPPDPITKDNVDDLVHWANQLVAGGYLK